MAVRAFTARIGAVGGRISAVMKDSLLKRNMSYQQTESGVWLPRTQKDGDQKKTSFHSFEEFVKKGWFMLDETVRTTIIQHYTKFVLLTTSSSGSILLLKQLCEKVDKQERELSDVKKKLESTQKELDAETKRMEEFSKIWTELQEHRTRSELFLFKLMFKSFDPSVVTVLKSEDFDIEELLEDATHSMQESIFKMKILSAIHEKTFNGYVPHNEIEELLNVLGKEYDKSYWQTIVQKDTADGNESVEFSQFVKLVSKLKDINYEEDLLKAFARNDKDGDGYLSVAEVRQLLGDIKVKLSEEEIEKIMRAVGSRNDDRVSFEDLKPRVLG